ncbi:putative tRNA pseudouridine synthase Pus10 [Glugoides intestinalis]
MESVVKDIEASLENSCIEKYANVVYQIKNTVQEVKMELKLLLKQGDPNKYHTVVEVDFTKDSENTSTKPKITIYNSPIYVYGKYIKMARCMCQTPLRIKGKLKTERSVSDFSASFKEFFGASAAKFMGCGREDIDVRCLKGRPFILELSNPTKNLTSAAIPVNLYTDIDLIDVCIVEKACKDIVNCEAPSKSYNLLLFSDEDIKFEKSYELKQKTPLRVLHRRANITREKTVEVLNVKRCEKNGFYFDVDIKTSSGTYVKEWVNGDFGRTVPNLNADLLELDVIEIYLDIPQDVIIRPLSLLKKYTD